MTALVWSGAVALLVAAGLVAAYDKTEQARRTDDRCGCPRCDAGGSCAEDGAR